ncbi:MAG TPA: aminotransferase class I/II-fold pyridoxal phosphate-dependent enzyme [Acidimicrobiales bacterium]|nr:aminotransferase class I/II-fold pyridoxal phosphate-dependent enzyme [Acidimicrobiales bacterium]
MRAAGFTPPPYPYDRLDDARAVASSHEGGLVDLSIGTPNDPPPREVVAALASSGAERGYPASIGSRRLREAAVGWMARRFGVELGVDGVAACVGTKELVANVVGWLRLRSPDRDTVLYPSVSYPTYEMGAVLARCRAVPVDDLADVDDADAARALCLWVNSPANPTGALADLGAHADWGRARRVPVLSDECYAEFTWDGPPRTILEHGLDGVLAVHSLSKRSNLAGLRVGFYAGDPDLVHYLAEVRKHAGFMVPGPVQAAAVVALDDDAHVDEQRRRYLERLTFFADVLRAEGVKVDLPGGSFYLWGRAPAGDVDAPDGDAWGFTRDLAERGGVLVSPGDLYGGGGAGHVRVAMVQPMDRLRLVAARLAG